MKPWYTYNLPKKMKTNNPEKNQELRRLLYHGSRISRLLENDPELKSRLVEPNLLLKEEAYKEFIETSFPGVRYVKEYVKPEFTLSLSEAFPDEDQSKLIEHVKLLMLSKLLHP